ncbi:MAG: toast rack family protein [Pirellulales bacterium]
MQDRRSSVTWRTIAALGAIVVVALALLPASRFAVRRVGRGQSFAQVVRRDGAETVRAVIEMKAGELNLSAGASDLLQAQFDYNVSAWKPEVTYTVRDGRGDLTVRQPAGGIPLGSPENRWDLRLADDVPLDMNVALDVGEAELKLAGLSLTRLNAEVGTGELTVDLTGPWQRDFTARIEGGIGECTVLLPGKVGVRVEVDRGIGELDVTGLTRDGDAYVNKAYGSSPVTLQIEVGHTIGELDLRVRD